MAPADVEMLSLMSVPPKSLAPHERSHWAWRMPVLHPRDLEVLDGAAEHQARDRVEADDVVAGRAGAQLGELLPQRHRRLFVHEREGHELGEAAGLALDGAQEVEVPHPLDVGLDVPVHDRGRRPQADAWAVVTTSIHSAVVMRPGAMRARTRSSSTSAEVPGSEPRPASFSSSRTRGRSSRSRLAAYFTSSGEKACTCSSGAAAFSARHEVDVEARVDARREARLDADLRRAERPAPRARGARSPRWAGSTPPRCVRVRENAQKRHALTHTLVKLTLRLTT